MTRFVLIAALAATLPLAGCSQPAPAAEAQVRFGLPAAAQSIGLQDPAAETVWSGNQQVVRFGVVGQVPLLELACTGEAIEITRNVPAEIGAGALFALQGRGGILRLAVDAVSASGSNGYIWKGSIPASDEHLTVFDDAFTGTLPGGGLISVPANDLARDLVHKCADQARALKPSETGQKAT